MELLLVQRAFCCRHGLEAVVRDRFSAFDREPEGTRGKSRFGAFESCELLGEILRETCVELSLVERFRALVAGIVLSGERLRVVLTEARECLLYPLSFPGE